MCTAAAACAHFDRPSAGFELLLFSDRQAGGLTSHDEHLLCSSAETRDFLERLCFQLLALPLSLASLLPFHHEPGCVDSVLGLWASSARSLTLLPQTCLLLARTVIDRLTDAVWEQTPAALVSLRLPEQKKKTQG